MSDTPCRKRDNLPLRLSGVVIILTAANTVGLVAVRVEERRDSDNDVRSTEQRALEVVAAAVEDEEVDDEGRDEHADGLEEGEVQAHVLVHDPAQDDD